MTDNDKMPFGKYKGEKMANVPSTYLLWCYEQDWCNRGLRTYIENNLDALTADAKRIVKEDNR